MTQTSDLLQAILAHCSSNSEAEKVLDSGVGGGFLIVPALVFSAGLDTRMAEARHSP